MSQSPYLKYDEILHHGRYGTAYRLQELVLGFYDPGKFHLHRDDCWGGFDANHRGIYQELADWYREHGNDEPSFVTACRAIIARDQQQVADVLAELTQLRAMQPGDCPAEFGETSEGAYKAALESCEHFLTIYRSQGFMDK